MQAQDLGSTPFLDLAFLFARAMIGLLMAAHGAQKLFGWFGGHGLRATGEFFGHLGFLGPVGPALMLAVMVVAAISFQWVWAPSVIWAALSLGVLGGVGNLALRRRSATA